MLRQVLGAVFGRIGPDAAREKLGAMQQPGEIIDTELNRALLSWAKEKCQPDAVKELSGLLLNTAKNSRPSIPFGKQPTRYATRKH